MTGWAVTGRRDQPMIRTRGLRKRFGETGVLVQSLVLGTTSTSVALVEDLHDGIVDRFCALPISRSAVLIGRVASHSVRMLLTVLRRRWVQHSARKSLTNPKGWVKNEGLSLRTSLPAR
ncbi:MAG: hypothetical protein V3S75_06500 [Euzebya tangerina]|nr:hypothetical protein [Euzebya tangerina]